MDMMGFDELADLALRKSGQAVKRSHAYLIEARLGNILRRENFSTLHELSECLKARPNIAFENEVVAAMANKQSSFFHERETLEHIVEVMLPRLVREQEEAGEHQALRVMCAGGGTGQEAYSLAILLDEADEQTWLGRPIELVSVDMCRASTMQAEEGLYGHFEIQMGLSVHRMLKYFSRKDESWVIADKLRKKVNFKVENLIDPFDEFETFDIILCRNVFPFMAVPIATSLAQRLCGLLAYNGVLFAGVDEDLNSVPGFYNAPDVRGGYCFDPALREQIEAQTAVA